LKRTYAATPPGLCPFCLAPIPPSKGRPRKFCGDPECVTAYHRLYARDRRADDELKAVFRDVVETEWRTNKLGGQSIVKQVLSCGHVWKPPAFKFDVNCKRRRCDACTDMHRQQKYQREGNHDEED